MKKIFSGDVSRRTILKTTATAALVSAVRVAFPSGAFAATAEPEVKGAKIGFIARLEKNQKQPQWQERRLFLRPLMGGK